ncbi:hypothetical protein [Streptomyces sp. NPDC057909]|uniref:hypothetical protein n=1 Tax=Streptomyces sp. NPDC057909 TaxID=3346277 RepID=UPI0036E59C0C
MDAMVSIDPHVGRPERRRRPSVGPNIGEIYGDSLVRPDAPDRSLQREANHARISLLLNSRTTELDERADDHTVLVHVRRSNPNGSEQPRASWLAEQIGQSVIGPPQE